MVWFRSLVYSQIIDKPYHIESQIIHLATRGNRLTIVHMSPLPGELRGRETRGLRPCHLLGVV